ncbi:NAD(P)-binding protein [Leucobacter insecticola]|uniref:NAD(P)-binding protein n=1 Tax=Leucobacter insecticola TaxID=2714934 RepID=A0A6G8FGW9_9MICO|nr:FAD-dependent oxidoreductase [Leucobacter insecticola]QIM15597.1 NAD(P)-binding protein [Leucobacter insecticola]
MTEQFEPRVAVIGGGLAGLVAAWELARAGVGVSLFERSERLGGRIASAEIHGVRFDVGPESYATRGGEVERLLVDLGMRECITPTAGGRSWIVGDGRAAPLPAAAAIGIPAQPLSREVRRIIGLGGALRCAIEPWLPRSVGATAPSLGALVRARLGQRTLDRLVDPVVRGVYSARADALPLSAVPGLARAYRDRGTLRAAARTQRGSARASGAAVAGLRGGIHTLVTRLVDELELLGVELRLNAEVTAMRELVSGAGAAWEVSAGDDVERFDAVVVTVPGVVPPRRLSETGGRVETQAPAQRIEVLALLVESAALNAGPRGTGVLVADDARYATPPIAAKALTHANMKWRWLAEQLPPDHHLLRLSYGQRGSEAVTLPLADEAAGRLALADASAILGVPVEALSLRGIVRQQHTLPTSRQPESTKSTESTESVEPTALTPPGVVCAGEWVAGTGFAAVVPSARAAAATVLQALNASIFQPDPTRRSAP